MASYEFLAGSYDELTTDVDYGLWADYVERHFARLKRPVKRVLDLACGTGSLTAQLAARGYEMVGVDKSSDMLAVAEEKCRELNPTPRFFRMGMESLRLPEPVDACICCLDSVNYVLKPALLRRAFRRVYDCLAPGGLFLFDADTPEKLRAMDGEVFLDETEDSYCVWRGEFSKRRNVCTFWMDIFRREGENWSRGWELHEEYAYSMEELEAYLKEAGFETIKQFGELKLRPPREGEQRVFFAAGKKG